MQRPNLDLTPLTREAVCRDCPLRRTCVKVCQYVEVLLPSMEQGRVDAEDLSSLYQGRVMVHALLDHIEVLTPRQRDVVSMYYRERLQQTDIAAALSISQQAVADSLQRARISVGEKLRRGFKLDD